MPDQYDIGIDFKVYQIVHDGRGSGDSERYSLEFVRSFDTYSLAINWIRDEGYRHRDYIIIEVFRKK
jgi:hypothetical protein